MATKETVSIKSSDIGTMSINPATGEVMPTFEELARQGWVEEQTIKIGDGEVSGTTKYYAGEMIGPGSDIELNDQVSGQNQDGTPKTIPTWLFHPLNMATKSIEANINHRVIAPAMLDGQLKSLQALCMVEKKKAHVLIAFDGVGKNRVGQPLNKYRVMHKLVG